MDTVDVIIPAYHPGKEFEMLLKTICKQDYPIENILESCLGKGFSKSKGASFEKRRI